jgi:hypothetical protein
MSCWIVNRIAELKTQGRITDEHVKFLMNKIELLEEEGRILLEEAQLHRKKALYALADAYEEKATACIREAVRLRWPPRSSYARIA